MWVTSFALCAVDNWLESVGADARMSFWRNALDGLHVIWVGPSTVEYALRDCRPGESMEASIARVVAAQMDGELASDAVLRASEFRGHHT